MLKSKKMKAMIMAGTLAAGMCLGSTGVMAADATAPSVQKTFTMAEGIATPDVTFQFEATYTGNELNVPQLSISSITYTSADKADALIKNANITKADGGVLQGSDFPHAGVYEYKVKETNEEDPTPNQTYDNFIYDQKEYTLKIYVKNTENDALEIAEFKISDQEGNKEDSLAFENIYKKRGNADGDASLTITKETTGTYADKTKDFSFTITIWPSSTETGEDINYTGNIGTNKITVPADGKTAVEFSLSDGDSLVFTELPAGTHYLVTEKGAQDGYTPSVYVTENNVVTVQAKTAADSVDLASNGENDANNLVGEGENSVVFTNTYQDIIPTGIILNNLPFVILIGAAAAGFIAYVVVRRKIAR